MMAVVVCVFYGTLVMSMLADPVLRDVLLMTGEDIRRMSQRTAKEGKVVVRETAWDGMQAAVRASCRIQRQWRRRLANRLTYSDDWFVV